MKFGLSRSLDLMRISQGLMSNMPLPCAETAEIFPTAFGMPLASDDGYGPFVPDIIKSRTYNFSFGPRP
jgi:hypothetical protein